ncbi:MAG: ATP-binding cassette domain-containing protein [Flavobacteriales bacterium]
MNHLKGTDITLGYGEKSLVSGFDFDLRSGQIIALLGLNGSGKTTLFKTLMDTTPLLGGDLLWNGISMRDFSFSSRQKIFSWLPARRALEESLKVYELLSYSAAAVNNEDVLKSKKTLEVMTKITDLMKLHPFLEMPYHSLSEGQKKKVEIAAMFMKDAPICLLDEPSVFLDISNQKEIAEILRWFAKEEGKIILFSSHDLALIENVAETCWVIHDNKIQVNSDIKETILEYTRRYYTEIMLIEN